MRLGRNEYFAEMSISDGLKEALVKCGFINRLQLLSYTTGELDSMLKIDEYAARLILEGASNSYYLYGHFVFTKTTFLQGEPIEIIYIFFILIKLYKCLNMFVRQN